MLGCQKDGLENSAGSIYFPADWDIARSGLVNALQQTFQCMPEGLGEVSIPNPHQKVKDKLTWSCKYFTNTFSIQ